MQIFVNMSERDIEHCPVITTALLQNRSIIVIHIYQQLIIAGDFFDIMPILDSVKGSSVIAQEILSEMDILSIKDRSQTINVQVKK